MILYILKTTLIWLVLLLLFEFFYKTSARHTLNRLYILVALFAGAFIPLLPLGLKPAARNDAAFEAMTTNVLNSAASLPAALTPAGSAGPAFPYETLLWWLYGGGAAILLLLSLKEAILIIRKAIYGQYLLQDGQKIFVTGRSHAPFSFMGWIFIGSSDGYDPVAMGFILRHEHAHNLKRHWLDLLVMQLFNVMFWFHPLVWRFRHLLKLEHEYEADADAAGEDAYSYGHFLLQQTLLKGTPSIAHSFHYSPIKKRINMLTTNNRMNKGWKYAAAIPALLCCTLLMAKSTGNHQRVRVGDKTTFMGNEFMWSAGAIDSISVADPVTNEATWMVMRKTDVIASVNKQPVFPAEDLTSPPQFRSGVKNFSEYLKSELTAAVPNMPDTIAQIDVDNIVLDEKGKIIYYDLRYINTTVNNIAGMNFTHPLLDPVMDRIISKSPLWMPGIKDGKAVPAYMRSGGAVSVKSVSMTHTFKGRVVERENLNGDNIIQSDSVTITFPQQKAK